MRSRRGRNKAWNEITKNNLWYTTVVKDSMSKRESEELEVQLIAIYKPKGNTQTKLTCSRPLNTEYIDTAFCYDETSPSGIRYKIHNGNWGPKRRDPGDIAGYTVKSKTDGGERYVVVKNRQCMFVHRIVWYLCTGEDPLGFVIDHLDGNPSNNLISNLRKVTNLENSRNLSKRKDNLTGHTGVRLDECDGYAASWYESGVGKSKSFSCKKYGRSLALGLAVEYRHRMVTIHSSLTERHTGVYKRPKALDNFTEDDILKMFECDLTSSNTSGYRGLSRYKSGMWVYRVRGSKTGYFSVEKYGEELAKALATEFGSRFQGNVPRNIGNYSLHETNLLLIGKEQGEGLPGIAFSYLRGLCFVTARKRVNGKNVTKSFCVCNLGLLPATSEALCWYNSVI